MSNDIESPYLTTEEAAEYLKRPNAQSMRYAVHRFGIPHVRVGRQMLFTKRSLDEFVSIASEATNPTRTRRARRKAA